MFEHLPFGDALGISLLGIAIVFGVLVFLMCVISVLSAVVRAMNRPKTVTNPVGPVLERERMVKASSPAMVPAPGSMGEVALHSVDDKTAALLMAIVADDLGCELNELSFISIKEI